MNAKIIVLLLAFVWYAESCSKNSNNRTNNCSGNANCRHHKRIAGGNDVTFTVANDEYTGRVKGDPCVFGTYDKNGDNIITLVELIGIFGDRIITTHLYKKIDYIQEGDGITKAEFNDRVSEVIHQCKNQ